MVVRGMVNLIPYLLLLCGFYYLFPIVELPNGIRVSTISVYIVVGIVFLIIHHYRAWRRRVGLADAGH